VDSTFSAQDIARALGVRTVLESSVQISDGDWAVRLELIDAHYGRCAVDQGRSCSTGITIRLARVDPTGRLPDLAPLDDVLDWHFEHLMSQFFPERWSNREAEREAARAAFLDSSLSDQARLEALQAFSPTMVGPPVHYTEEGAKRLSGAVAVAVARLATEADDPYVRAVAWGKMRTVGDPYLIQPLLYSLANDDDPGVRLAAARVLLDFIEAPDVRYALEYAAENEPADRVRTEIRFSLLSDAEQDEALRAIVLDPTRPDKERSDALTDLRMDQFGDLNPFGDDMVSAMTALAKSSKDASVRSQIWSMLGWAEDRSLVPLLLDALATDPHEQVRSTAAEALGKFGDESRVLWALEQARDDDPSPLVRNTADRSIELIDR